MADTFRKVYKPLSDARTIFIVQMKDKAEELEVMFNTIKSREMSLAMTNLEQAMMWATKAAVLDAEKE